MPRTSASQGVQSVMLMTAHSAAATRVTGLPCNPTDGGSTPMRESRRSLRRLLAVAFPALALAVSGFVAAPTAGAAQPAAAAPHATAKVTQNAKALSDPARPAVHSTGK